MDKVNSSTNGRTDERTNERTNERTSIECDVKVIIWALVRFKCCHSVCGTRRDANVLFMWCVFLKVNVPFSSAFVSFFFVGIVSLLVVVLTVMVVMSMMTVAMTIAMIVVVV